MTATLLSSQRSIQQSSIEQPCGLQPLSPATDSPPLHLVVPEGQIQIHTAPYRGSFSGVLSEALRAAGLGRKVMVAQFLKGGVDQGPKGVVRLCDRLEWMRPAVDLETTEQSSAKPKDEAVKAVWEVCKHQLISGDLDQLVLDEVGLAIALGFIKEKDFIATLEKRPAAMDVILTGPSIPCRVIEIADQVTELRCGF